MTTQNYKQRKRNSNNAREHPIESLKRGSCAELQQESRFVSKARVITIGVSDR